VEYEHLQRGVVFSQCRACLVLFASHRFEQSERSGLDDVARAALAAALATATRYLGRAPLRPAILSSLRVEAIEGIAVHDPSRLAGAQTFDAMLVVDALERVADPEAFLRGLLPHLEAGGAVVLMVPSTASREARAKRWSWEQLGNGSAFFFSPDNLQLLATRCGLGDFLVCADAASMGSSESERAAPWFFSSAFLVCREVQRPHAHLLSVIFPVYNEERTVEPSLLRVLEKEIPGVDIEVIVVENNSTDGTRAITERYRNHPRVRLIFLDRARGKGFAVRAGLDHARGEVVLIQDADLEYDVGDYDRLVAPLFNLQRTFVLGSRHNGRREGWKVRNFDSEPVLTRIFNVGHVALVTMFNVLYRQRLRDPFTMYKVFRRDCLYGLSFECERFDFDLELVIKLLRKGYQPVELPVNYRSRSFRDGKKISFFRDPPDWVRAMLAFRRRPLYDFDAVTWMADANARLFPSSNDST
jgi:glycosyltransferase involved in cell wall biosynthesis